MTKPDSPPQGEEALTAAILSRLANGAPASPSGSQASPEAAPHLRPTGVDPSRMRQRRDEDGFACEYDPGCKPETDTYTITWDGGARWLIVDRYGLITAGQSPASDRAVQQTTWEALMSPAGIGAQGIEAEGQDAKGGLVHEGSLAEGHAPALTAALARVERLEKALAEAADWHDSAADDLAGLPQNSHTHWWRTIHGQRSDEIRSALTEAGRLAIKDA